MEKVLGLSQHPKQQQQQCVERREAAMSWRRDYLAFQFGRPRLSDLLPSSARHRIVVRTWRRSHLIFNLDGVGDTNLW
jgi:hypothetical protein